jgi:hypothetical protein
MAIHSLSVNDAKIFCNCQLVSLTWFCFWLFCRLNGSAAEGIWSGINDRVQKCEKEFGGNSCGLFQDVSALVSERFNSLEQEAYLIILKHSVRTSNKAQYF